jgi:PAS domain S-box-containing protein
MSTAEGGVTKRTGVRQQAAKLLQATQRDVADMSVKEVQHLAHDLQLHQIELDMQNEELRRTQLELETVRDRYMELYEFSPSGYLTLKRDSTIVEANLRAGTLLGVTRKELVGQPLTRFLASDDQDVFHRHCREILTTGRRQRCEVRLRKPVGATEWVHLESLAVGGKPGRITLWRTALLDITDRKRVEEMRARLAAMAESSTDAIVSLTDGRVSFWNAAAERLFGYSSDDILGEPADILVPPHRRGEIQRTIAAVFAGKRIQDFETERVRKNGSLAAVSISVSIVRDSSGNIQDVFANIRDITERKRTEQRLQDSSDQLRTLSQRLNVVREEERAKIARELHDELGVRLTCLKLDLVRMRMLMEDPTCHCETIDEKIHSMLSEVDCTISSVQRLVTELRPGVLDDLGLVAAIEWQCQDFERRSGIRCSCKAKGGDIQLEGPLATAAFRICQEALMNVARHANATALHVLITQVNRSLLLAIRDNGVGIPVEKLTASTSLGLLGMRERAAGLGGTVKIIGLPGKGTTVIVRVPLSSRE